MNESENEKFVDHPAPSIGLMTLFIGLICVLIGAFVPALAEIPRDELGGEAAFIGFCCVMVFSIGVLSFYLWPL